MNFLKCDLNHYIGRLNEKQNVTTRNWFDVSDSNHGGLVYFGFEAYKILTQIIKDLDSNHIIAWLFLTLNHSFFYPIKWITNQQDLGEVVTNEYILECERWKSKSKERERWKSRSKEKIYIDQFQTIHSKRRFK